MIRYTLIRPHKYGGWIGWLIKVYNTIIYIIAEDKARALKQDNGKRWYLSHVENKLYLYSREDHLQLMKLTGKGIDFLQRIKYCRFYTDDRKKKQIS